jgi:hypothetical protein
MGASAEKTAILAVVDRTLTRLNALDEHALDQQSLDQHRLDSAWFVELARLADQDGLETLRDIATLARDIVPYRPAADDLSRHLVDVLVLACQNERRRCAGDATADLAGVVQALRDHVAYARRDPSAKEGAACHGSC